MLKIHLIVLFRLLIVHPVYAQNTLDRAVSIVNVLKFSLFRDNERERMYQRLRDIRSLALCSGSSMKVNYKPPCSVT